jgi:hypothetical protein
MINDLMQAHCVHGLGTETLIQMIHKYMNHTVSFAENGKS